jgi:3-(3-hydroxy-phenyl)propionate hydroxylase
MANLVNTRVLVVGAGPCGVTIANHLGMYGIDTLVLERSEEILDYPRAVGVDDESLRSWQAVGLTEELLGDMIQNAPARYHNSKGRCFAYVRPGEQPFGWPRRNMFMQPLTEVGLRKGLERYPNVMLKLGWEVTDLKQDARNDGGVEVVARSATGELMTVKADYVVGADGGKSVVRGQVGIELQGMTHASKWLVIDVEDDALYEPFSGIYCDPKRPHMVIDLPYGYRRFEFMLLPEDRDEETLMPQNVQRLLATHYKDGVPMPTIKRARIYLHHSRIANRLREGRVFLAGDAAHLQPPFFGQGMNSGLRDVTNLAWKLAMVLDGRAPPRILESYDVERRGHALAMVNFATWIGSFYRPRNRFTEILRDAFFDVVQSLPNVRDYILQLRFKPMPRYTEGLVYHPSAPGKGSVVGRMFMQPFVETKESRRLRLDDAIGNGFAVLGINVDPGLHLTPEDRVFWDKIGARIVQVNKSRSGGRYAPASGAGTLVLDDVDGKFRDWSMDRPREQIIVLRPDRYVAAVCERGGVAAMTRAMRGILN